MLFHRTIVLSLWSSVCGVCCVLCSCCCRCVGVEQVLPHVYGVCAMPCDVCIKIFGAFAVCGGGVVYLFNKNIVTNARPGGGPTKGTCHGVTCCRRPPPSHIHPHSQFYFRRGYTYSNHLPHNNPIQNTGESNFRFDILNKVCYTINTSTETEILHRACFRTVG